MSFEQPPITSPEANSEPSPERKQALIDAKNALKEVIENIPHDKLKTMSDGLTFELIESCDGDVNKYARALMEGSGNDPDTQAFHVTEELVRIKERLENKD